MKDTTKQKLKSWGADIFFALFFLIAGAFLYHQYIIYKGTQVEQKAIDIVIPGYVDVEPEYIPVELPKKIKPDSSAYWKHIGDSLQSIINKKDSSGKADSTFAEYFHPYQVPIRDSLTTNWITVFPLNPLDTRVRLDSTRYDTIKIHYVYLDTTINVTKGNDLTTYGLVAIGAAAGSAAKDELGAAIGSVAALLIDWIFF